MEKIKPSVGIKKEGLGAEKKSKKRPPEKFFRQAGVLWIELYGEVMPLVNMEKAIPSFWKNGAETRSLKTILIELRERAELKKIVWTEEEMKKRLRAFLMKAWEDSYISGCFQLRIISLNRTKLFNNQITQKNGRKDNTGRTSTTPTITTKPKGGFGQL